MGGGKGVMFFRPSPDTYRESASPLAKGERIEQSVVYIS